MKSQKFLDFVEEMKKPVFTVNDVCRITGKPRGYVRLFIFRLKRKGEIEEIERGKYTTASAHMFSVASNILFPSYISLFSGLSFYGETTQIPRIVSVVALKSKTSIKLKDYEIKFIKLKKSRFFGYWRQEYIGKIVFIGEIEKVILDSLLLPKYCLIKETNSALKNSVNKKSVNIKKLIKYAKKMKSSVLAKRLGYLLELCGIDESENLREMFNSKYEKLNPFLKKSKNKSKKWKLIINEKMEE